MQCLSKSYMEVPPEGMQSPSSGGNSPTARRQIWAGKRILLCREFKPRVASFLGLPRPCRLTNKDAHWMLDHLAILVRRDGAKGVDDFIALVEHD
jgi:hypothetical protein